MQAKRYGVAIAKEQELDLLWEIKNGKGAALHRGGFMVLWEWEKDSVLHLNSPYIPAKDIFQAVCNEIGRYYRGKGLQYIKSKRELKWEGIHLWCKLGLWSSHSNINGEWINLEIVASVFALDLSDMQRKGILDFGLQPKNFNVYQISLDLFSEIICHIDNTIKMIRELDTQDGLARLYPAASKEDFIAANPNNLQYLRRMLGERQTGEG